MSAEAVWVAHLQAGLEKSIHPGLAKDTVFVCSLVDNLREETDRVKDMSLPFPSVVFSTTSVAPVGTARHL